MPKRGIKVTTKYTQYKTKIERCGVHEQLGPTGSGWWIEQNPAELAAFLCKLDDLGMRQGDNSKVLEIGTAKGGLYQFFRNIMGWDVFVIDIEPAKACHLKDHYFKGRSDAPQSVKWAKRKGPFRMIFIDADHSYNAVKKDYELYGDIGKIIAFHDVCGLRDCEGAKKFFDELVEASDDGKNYQCGKAVAQDEKTRAGIGWVIK